MTFLEYLDRVGERNKTRKPWDTRLVIGFLFLAGYYWLLSKMINHELPAANAGLVRDGFLVLGPPIGAIVNALFRTDSNDELRTQNTARAMDTIKTVAQNTGNSGEPQPVQVVNDDSAPVPTADARG